MTLYPCLHPQSLPSHLFSETGTPYGAAWKVRPSGPDRGLHRAAAYVPANTNTHVGTQASTHWRGISLSAPHVGFDCETLEQRNVKGAPRRAQREVTSYLFNICSPDTPPGEWVGLWAVVGHSPKGEEKKEHGDVTPSCSIVA